MDDELLAAVDAREAASAALRKTDPLGALRLALADPPYGRATAAAVREASTDVVCRALLLVREAEIDASVGALSLEECDVLMKYIYAGLGQRARERQYAPLLRWHAHVLKRAGQGSIVRVISEVQRQL